ncbi:EVE domain-containing protein [Burkholderiaceae bacterium FT117]|uniref:EVE domain-containing protein n=1 Tax=Zeimonas sediminis TaxID=2944268 RepID=UPI002342E57A|nr:EVE domain-containing protein [Zeimonas sediminis]MCM5570489.1 EVE domain-containing protein [Zeimonas sediminis]
MISEGLIRTYFEADRSAVKQRYDLLFPAASKRAALSGIEAKAPSKKRSGSSAAQDLPPAEPMEPLPEGASLRDLTKAVLRNLGRMLHLPKESTEELQSASLELGIFDTGALVHFLNELNGNGTTNEYVLEGLTLLLGPKLATAIVHNWAPLACFPVDTDLPYPRLKAQFRAAGIEYDDGEQHLTASVLINISYAVSDYLQKHKLEPWQVWALVYDLGPRLLPEQRPFPTDPPPRIWLTAAGPENYASVDAHQPTDREVWSANPRAKYGDLLLMYCRAPRSAIVGVYRCMADAYRDPLNQYWTGVWTEIGEKLPLPYITFAEMRSDPILKNWAMVKMQFQGLMKHAIPDEYWKRLQEMVAAKDANAGALLSAYAASATGVRLLRTSPGEMTEKDFEDTVLLPLLGRLGWQLGKSLDRQIEMPIKVGSGRPILARADIVGYKGPLGSDVAIVIESKRSIRNSAELEQAMLQAESYAGRLRCTRFAVAAPEGIWVYEMSFPSQSRALTDQPVPLEEKSVGRLRELLGRRNG